MSKWPPPIQHHKASGQARVRWLGRDYYLGKYGSPEAAAAYARLLTQLAEGQPPVRAKDPPPLTVAQVVADWSARVLPTYNAAGKEPLSYRCALAPLLKVFGSLPARDFDCGRLERVRQEMISQGWCRNVINRRVVRIRTLWRWAEAQGHVPRGSWAHLRTLPGLKRNNQTVRHTEPVVPALWQEVLAVARQCQPVLKAMLLLHWWCGCRSGEVVRLTLGEIDRSGAIWIYRPRQHKMAYLGQPRSIALGRKCQAVLQKWLQPTHSEGYLFLTRWGQPYTPYSYAQGIRRAAQRAGVKGFHPYRCRHAAKLRFTRALGLDAARAALGQKSLDTTNGYAAQIDLETARRVAGEMC